MNFLDKNETEKIFLTSEINVRYKDGLKDYYDVLRLLEWNKNSNRIDTLFTAEFPYHKTEFLNSLHFLNGKNDILFASDSSIFIYHYSNKRTDAIHLKVNIENLICFEEMPYCFVQSNSKMYLTNIYNGSIMDSVIFSDNTYFSRLRYTWHNGLLFVKEYSKLISIDPKKFDLNLANDFDVKKRIEYINNDIEFIPNLAMKAKSIEWDFGDGAKSNEFFPSHSYKFPGEYTIRLITDYGFKKDTILKQNFIEILMPLKCDFSADKFAGLPPLVVNFENLSNGNVLEYLWDFGDGTTSNEMNPKHIYDKIGFYHVKLVIKDKISSQFLKKNFFINCDSLDINIITDESKFEIHNNYSQDILLKLDLPIRSGELAPGLETVWLYRVLRVVQSPTSNFESESLLLYTIEGSSVKSKGLALSKEYFYTDIVNKKKYELNNLYLHNFYPDSCNSNAGVFSQKLFPVNVSIIKNNGTLIYPIISGTDTNEKFAKMYNSKDLLISSVNYLPLDLNKSMIVSYTKIDSIVNNRNDTYFRQINQESISGNICNFDKVSPNEFIAPVTYFKQNKSIIDIIKINSLGEITSKESFVSKFNSIYLHHFIKLNGNYFVACGVAGDSATKGKPYLLLVNEAGKLVNEAIFESDVENSELLTHRSSSFRNFVK